MDIALCFDNNFIMQAGVTIKSVCLSNSQENIVFHLFTSNISENNKSLLLSLLTNNNHIIRFYEIDESILIGWPKVSRYPKSIYYRFFIAKVVPNTVKYILYLDCDIIVRDSLKELYQLDFKDKIIAAVLDRTPFEVETMNRLRLPIEEGYFNSGVMVIDVKKWKERNVTELLCKFIHDNSKNLVYPDQDALNCFFCCNWKRLHLRYNLQQGFIYEKTKLYWPYFDELYEAQRNPAIIHFSGIKPWTKECYNPFKRLWIDVLLQTPWKDFKPRRLNLFKKAIIELKIFLINHIHVINERQAISKNCTMLEDN